MKSNVFFSLYIFAFVHLFIVSLSPPASRSNFCGRIRAT